MQPLADGSPVPAGPPVAGPTILSYTGLEAGSAITQALIAELTNVVFTVVAILLLDRIGRRPLLLVGTVGLTVALALLGAFFAFPSWQQSAPWLPWCCSSLLSRSGSGRCSG